MASPDRVVLNRGTSGRPSRQFVKRHRLTFGRPNHLSHGVRNQARNSHGMMPSAGGMVSVGVRAIGVVIEMGSGPGSQLVLARLFWVVCWQPKA